jgi:hypothetical protein
LFQQLFSKYFSIISILTIMLFIHRIIQIYTYFSSNVYRTIYTGIDATPGHSNRVFACKYVPNDKVKNFTFIHIFCIFYIILYYFILFFCYFTSFYFIFILFAILFYFFSPIYLSNMKVNVTTSITVIRHI